MNASFNDSLGSTIPSLPPAPSRASARTRRTRQQDAIIRVLSEADRPLDVVEVHERARRWACRVSRATIYRVLQRLQKEGKVRCIAPYNEAARYGLPGLSHNRFCCRVCQGIFDLKPPAYLARIFDDSFLANASLAHSLPCTPLASGFRVESHELRLHGLCPNCVALAP